MPDKKKGGNPLTKKLGPLPAWGWAAAAAGGFFVWRWYEGRNASNAATEAQALSDENSVPSSSGAGTGVTTTSGTTAPTTLGQWEEDAIGLMIGPNYSADQAFNDITAWLNGQPVSSQGYASLSGVITQLGLPPTGGTLPPITVASTSTSTSAGSTSSTASGPGYGTVTIGGQTFNLLGYTTGGNFTGYNVGGGAPTFFQTPGGSPQTNLTAAQVAALPAGTAVLTPSTYASQIGSTSGTEQIT